MLDHLKMGVIMDPLDAIDPKKDTTLALLIEAQKKGFLLYYLTLPDLSLQYGMAYGYCRSLTIDEGQETWFSVGEPCSLPLDTFDVLLMRKDPPVNMDYIYATYILERAEQNGVLVLNKPQSLRDANEKIFATLFPQCLPPSLVTASFALIQDFIEAHEKIILKPLDGMGGKNVFKCEVNDPNLASLVDLMTAQGTRSIMAQQFIPEISKGDKRILLIDGIPIPYALARIPAPTDFRGNLAAGARGVGQALSPRDQWICEQIGPTLKEKGLLFVGIDIIGDYLTEINVTSPTGVRELDAHFGISVAETVINCILDKIKE